MFDKLKNALLSVGVPVSRYFASQQPNQYIVWAEDGQADSLQADNAMVAQALTGTADYFTKTEDDPNFHKIQKALNASGVAWRLASIQHEDETGYIHYEWVWEVTNGENDF